MVDEDHVDQNGTPVFENSFSDTLINAEVLLPQGEDLQNAQVMKCCINAVSIPMGGLRTGFVVFLNCAPIYCGFCVSSHQGLRPVHWDLNSWP